MGLLKGKRVMLVDPADLARLGKFDNMVKAPIVMDHGHHEIHDGSSFEVCANSANAAVAAVNVAFKTAPGTKLAHLLISYASSDEVLVELLEGPVWTQGSGTEREIHNANRENEGDSAVFLENKGQSQFTASDTAMQDVTITDDGEVIKADYTYNASQGISVVQVTRLTGREWVLKPDTTYAVRITKTDANCKISLCLEWYEHLNV